MVEQQRNYADECGDHGGTNSSGNPCGRPAGWGTDFDSGKCRHHRGTSPDGKSHEGNQNAAGNSGGAAPEKNQNARTHAIHATPEYLLEDLGEHHVDTYHATYEALCTRYERVHGYQPDFAMKKSLSRDAVAIVKTDLVDEYLREKAEDNPLVEKDTIQDPETGELVEVERSNKLNPAITALKRELRLSLKDKGLLEDPESKKAQAGESFLIKLAEAIHSGSN